MKKVSESAPKGTVSANCNKLFVDRGFQDERSTAKITEITLTVPTDFVCLEHILNGKCSLRAQICRRGFLPRMKGGETRVHVEICGEKIN